MLFHSDRAVPAPSFVAAYDRRAGCALKPARVVRLGARLHGQTLDWALIAGADPADCNQLAARAAWLTKRSTRAEIADGLERLVEVARDESSGRRIRPRRRAVLASEPELAELAELLRGPAPVYAQGLAMLRQLVTDGTGPAYVDDDGAALPERLRSARLALGG
jgi:hypothetical protein